MKNRIYFKKANFKNFFINSIKIDGIELLKCKYIIPDFQRNYVWKIENINKLIQSIKEEKNYNYYGNIVIYTSPMAGEDYIIDGQQRFITLSLILKILERRCKNKDIKLKINKFLIKGDSKPKITFFNKDNDIYYKSFIKNNDSIQSSFFSKKVSKIIKQIKDNDIFKKIDTDEEIADFVNKISKMEFGAIVCDDLAKAYSLFNSLNSTGVALTSSEKIKNAFLSKVNDFSKTKQQYRKVSNKWKNLEKGFEKEDISLFNRFFRHQWYLHEGKVSDRQLYPRFEKEIANKINSFESADLYLKETQLNAKIYLDIRSTNPMLEDLPNQENRISKNIVINYIKHINLLNLEQIYPVILALYKFGLENQDYFKNGTFRIHIKMFWFFSVLAKYGGVIPNKYENKFANLCYKKERETDKQYCSRIENFIKKEMYEILKFSKKKFKTNFAKEYNDSLQKSAFDILYNLNSGLKIIESDLILEHIVPQGKNGKGSFGHWGHFSEKEYEDILKYIFNIGNITILEKRLEKRCENKVFSEKVFYYNKSKIPINKKIGDYNFDKKSIKKSIIKRGEELSGLFFDFVISNIKDFKK